MLRNRLPSSRSVVYVLAACAFPIHFFCLLLTLVHVPAWVVRLEPWELVGAIAYAQVPALLDSVLLFICLLLLSAVLPSHWLSDKFLPLGSMLALVTVLWAIIAPSYVWLADERWRMQGWLAWSTAIGFYLLMVALLYTLIQRSENLDRRMRSMTERLSVVAFLYMFVSVCSLVFVVVRNVV